MSKECNCIVKDRCNINIDMVCTHCKKKGFDKLNRYSHTGYDFNCLCDKCIKIYRDNENKEIFNMCLFLLKTDKIHCIKCTRILSYRNIGGKDIHYCTEDKVGFTCPRCKLSFSLYHGTPDDDYEDNYKY